MLQLIYVSSKTPTAADIDLDELVELAGRGNARDGITGLLFSDGRRFLQVIEGPKSAIERLVARLKRDPRHRALVTLSRRAIAAREFGNWSMARKRAGEQGDAFAARLKDLCRHADPGVTATFVGLVEARAAARA